MNACRPLLVLLLLGTATLPVHAQPPAAKPGYRPIARTTIATPAFRVTLRTDTQTLARLSPINDPAFDFVPGAREAERAGDGYVHIGDIHLRLRKPGGLWTDFASAQHRAAIRRLPTNGATFAAADITASLGADSPLRVERRWVNDRGILALRFTLTNTTDAPVEVGGLGLPMVFDNIISDRTLEQAHAQASFVDPYIGRDAGYLQVTRLNGAGPALLVLPEKGTPLEAYRPILEAAKAPTGDLFTDRSKRGQTSEGFYDWTIASKGFAEREWAKAGEQWNVPTSFTLAPGTTRTIGVRFVTAAAIAAIEDTLVANHRPVAVGIPGYVVPTDQDVSLFLKTPQPITRVESFPAGALTATPTTSAKGWARYTVRSKGWGRATLAVTYADGSVQTVSYFITKPLDQTMADLGRFSTTQQWYEGKSDPFGRNPAILTYDREAGKVVTQDPRVWISGMSDEGGAGSWVAAIAKQLDNPDPVEIAKLQRLIDETIQGGLQIPDGPHAGAVRKSLFYYDPAAHPGYYDPTVDWTTWTSWSKKAGGDLGRAYNYPHVAVGHWVLYRVARNHPGLVTAHPWRWYLDHAYRTTTAMMRDAPHYTQFGLMEGDVFVDILKDLKREGLTAEATEMERLMKTRADHWRTLAFPFGSEMAWDSTGQPEVYAWMRYFGYQPQADVTRRVILAYDPTIPNWGYNGNARRYWDFLYGGKYPRIERQIHHYGSTLNAVPLFDAYRADPSDLRMLRIAYGGMMGGITNIDRDGFSSAAFHSAPDMMQWDPYSGDYGMGFYGHAITAATYLVNDPAFGWLGFGGNLNQAAGAVGIAPKDGARTRLFIAPAGLWITLEAGKIARASYAPATGAVTLTLDPATAISPNARVFLETTSKAGRTYFPAGGSFERGGYTVPLKSTPTDLTLSPR
ncbi:DUF5695 domain-containing protein [Sphingomonas prati]|uniref:Glycoside hydrolase n=1 Tax=Sphingomonas prati TaxID=1843237 RepID=A0A7W9BUR7_9SPHN|nr:DUF5695 domain-containing protein [Sphingomonas prati]MBB5730477.1 hypothetical protein [Sphingomonas prati]GGE94340.1 hypothetical protein GCM10011404_29270 [Sphingomonas prati]